jgi:S-formylglutathione hydrolase FrmB
VAFCELHYFSEPLQKQTAATVLLPESNFKGPFPVFYLLNGLSDDHTIWMRRTNIERYVSGLPLIVVMPNGARGFYCDAPQGAAHQADIVDLVRYVDTRFQTRAERSARCIGGFSMGGYGAVKLALQYPDLFSSANSHAGALSFGHGSKLEFPETKPVLGQDADGGGPNDVYRLIAEADRSKLPHLLIDCGVDDFLIEESRAFHAHLEKLGVPHDYKEHPGAHNWDYCDLHVQEAVAFHARHLGLS